MPQKPPMPLKKPKTPQPTNISDIIRPPRTPSALNDRIQRELKQMRRTINAFKRAIYVLVGILVVVAISLAVTFSYHRFSAHTSPDPVPLTIRKSVNFPVYYPDQAKLPLGYMLNLNSFSSANQAVIYTVSYDGGKKLVFSLQTKPSDQEINTFYRNQIPLHFTVQTAVGTAVIGVIGQQNILSLPTTGKTWVIITAPIDANIGQLKQVLQAIKKG